MAPRPLYSKIQLPDVAPDFIRLVTIESNLENKRVDCRLNKVPLSGAPRYSALSYTWASPFLRPDPDMTLSEEQQAEYTVFCNDEPLPVFYNLYHALLRLGQPPYRGRPFWIDRISIDQDNMNERSHQVDLMAEIFKSAEQVVIWLGPEDEYTKSAFELMAVLCVLSEADRHSITPHNLTSSATQRLSLPVFQEKSFWLALAHLFRRNYWARGWVVQEVLFANDISVICGKYNTSWQNLKDVSHFLATTQWSSVFEDTEYLGFDTVLPHHGAPTKLAASKRDLQSKSPFLNSIIRARRHSCHLLIDKVYSLYGIAHVSTAPGATQPKANYNLEISDAYKDATLNMLQSSEDFHVLAYAEGSNFRTINNLPSWVPDWSCSDLVGLGITGYRRYHAASKDKDIETEPQYLELPPHTNGPDVIRLKAARIDTVTLCGESKREVLKTKKFPRWLDIIQHIGQPYFNGQSAFEAFWRTLIFDTNEKGTCPAEPATGESFKVWLHDASRVPEAAAEQENFHSIIGDSPGSAPDATLFSHAFSRRTCLRFFRTEHSLLGLGTESLQSGDSIWLVPGSRVPLILREVEAGMGSRYELVGGTYLHGVMHGEGLDGIPSRTEKKALEFEEVEIH